MSLKGSGKRIRPRCERGGEWSRWPTGWGKNWGGKNKMKCIQKHFFHTLNIWLNGLMVFSTGEGKTRAGVTLLPLYKFNAYTSTVKAL